MADLLLTLLAIGVFLVLRHRYRLNKVLKSHQEEIRIRSVLIRGSAFTNKYRVWKWVYREILDIGGSKNVDY
ncbi:hypothetical protein ACRABS_004129 [Salmonella enterica subsp. enterica]